MSWGMQCEANRTYNELEVIFSCIPRLAVKFSFMHAKRLEKEKMRKVSSDILVWF